MICSEGSQGSQQLIHQPKATGESKCAWTVEENILKKKQEVSQWKQKDFKIITTNFYKYSIEL